MFLAFDQILLLAINAFNQNGNVTILHLNNKREGKHKGTNQEIESNHVVGDERLDRITEHIQR